MKLFAGGVRGTCVVAEPAFAGFGGDTTCFLITGADGAQAIVDAGSGLRTVASRLDAGGAPIRFFFTHYHFDHVLGFPHFAPLYRDGRAVEIAGPVCDETEPAEVVRRLFAPPLWPVAVEALRADLQITTLTPELSWREVGGLTVRWCPVRHPGGCLAYRFDEPATGRSLVIATDMEWAAASAGERDSFLRFCLDPRPPDLLLMDGHFTPENYEPHRGWGHSRWSDCAEVALLAGAKKLAVIHHDPHSPDGKLAELEGALHTGCPHGFLLRQGSELELLP